MRSLRQLIDAALFRLRRFLTAHSYPYRHLYHGDGSLYMERIWTMPRFTLREVEDQYGRYYKPKPWMPFALRLHHIATEDKDIHFHDHPWWFVSLVLTGGYVEARPAQRDPCFLHIIGEDDQFSIPEQEARTMRLPGSLAKRRATDRHRITFVVHDTWTWILLGRVQQWWGFYAVRDNLRMKIYWKDYPSVHHADAAAPRSER